MKQALGLFGGLMNSIRLVRPEELDAVWSLVSRTVALMLQRGNDQWGSDYPTPALYADDIANGELWCVSDETGAIMGVAAMVCRHEPDYAHIPFTCPEPAVSLHRIAVDPAFEGRGVATALFAQLEKLGREKGVDALRIDTYHLNDRMQYLIAKHGFRYVADTHYPDRDLPYHCYEKLLKEDLL